MAAVALALRSREYIDGAQHFVDVMCCVPGAHARAIKPGGIHSLKESIMETGYKRVRTHYSITPVHSQ
jgi:hypothetical protein